MKKVPCEVYSRIVGYFRPTQQWHAAKRQEFADRKTFDLSLAIKQAQEATEPAQ